eukprot:1452522-Rhodomonas_salina.1
MRKSTLRAVPGYSRRCVPAPESSLSSNAQHVAGCGSAAAPGSADSDRDWQAGLGLGLGADAELTRS